MVTGWSEVDASAFWQRRPTDSILRYPVSQQRQDILDERRDARCDAVQLRRHTFITQNRLQDADGQSIVFTPEAEDIQFWARFQSWTFCDGCGKLEPRKMLPAFHCGNPTPLTKSCKCSTAVYKVPVVDDIPLILRNLTEDDLCLLHYHNPLWRLREEVQWLPSADRPFPRELVGSTSPPEDRQPRQPPAPSETDCLLGLLGAEG